ncbi:DUF4411 family protein [Acetobacterium wieringae]|uniref:DUF4411 family protein n=1 Tax=Acetobacterium wieringae TaxID=52694 RepID=A0A5D0WJI5_9FIRM|nr:DUF4411 family protein [Acetobacterium wieringae]TYC84184.1 DUF4411 family protein [Acetobacterium wieringae]
MISYVIDTNIFSKSLKNLPFKAFQDVWEPWSSMMKNGKIVSVAEAYEELINYWGSKNSEEFNWLKMHKQFFLKPTNEEGGIVAEIFKSKKFREGVKEKSLRSGSPEADAFLVAKAKVGNGILVTDESDEKPNSEKIPNICEAFQVPYMKKEDFYILLKSIYYEKEVCEQVNVQYALGKSIDLKTFKKEISKFGYSIDGFYSSEYGGLNFSPDLNY